jgi:hypothetical protein
MAPKKANNAGDRNARSSHLGGAAALLDIKDITALGGER